MERRKFINLLGHGTVAVTLLPYVVSCTTEQKSKTNVQGILPSASDQLLLADGLSYETLISYGAPINEQDTFGINNDFLCFIPIENSENEGLLWVNHEFPSPLFIHGNEDLESKSKEQVEQEMYNVGGSIIHIKENNGVWEVQENSEWNKRITGFTKIPFNWDTPIKNATEGIGTLGNCAGGVTPWGTILTCEENYQDCYGDRPSDKIEITPSECGWEKYYPHAPEHYGWVVEVDPKTGNAQKHIALGRCAHECATVVQLKDERLVVYTGDDKNDECLYKFISSEPNSLKNGTLYVANVELGKWIPIDIEQSPKLKEKFTNQTDALVYLRESSDLLGGSKLARPEDIEIDPVDKSVLVSLTNNIPKDNYYGEILKIEETNQNHESLTFKASTYIAGGEEEGFACPDNMVFDRKGNLWFTSDISGSKMNTPPYETFKNNGLFLVLREGEDKGKAIQVASAPVDAELTGPWFSPDGKTLFLSVQHPGSNSLSLNELTSHWPDGGDSIPKSTVVCIKGDLINNVQGLS